jgi:hypothetical protein
LQAEFSTANSLRDKGDENGKMATSRNSFEWLPTGIELTAQQTKKGATPEETVASGGKASNDRAIVSPPPNGRYRFFLIRAAR